MDAAHDHLVAMLSRLKLTAIRDQLDSLVDEAGRRELTIREALGMFCEREIARKDERRIEMAIGLARFPFVRDLAGFDFAAQPSIDRAQVRDLAAGRFIAIGAAVLLLGPPGRARLPALRAGRGAPVLPARQPPLREGRDAGDLQPRGRRVGRRVRRAEFFMMPPSLTGWCVALAPRVWRSGRRAG